MDLATGTHCREQILDDTFIGIGMLATGIERVEFGVILCDATESVEQMHRLVGQCVSHQGRCAATPNTDLHDVSRNVPALPGKTMEFIASVNIHHRKCLNGFEDGREG